MELTMEQYKELESILSAIGIETRITRLSNGTVEWQARNSYRDWARLSPEINGKHLCELVEGEIRSGTWKR